METPTTERPPQPNSPLALAALHSRGKYSAEPRHLQLLDQALVYLAQRRAPVGFLRRLAATRAIDESLPDNAELPFTRLGVTMPPRHAKSVTCSQYFPAWYLGTHPDHRVILTSYEDRFARSWGRKARDVLVELGPEYFEVAVRSDITAADEWETTDGGGMLTAGVGGAITGRGANVLVVDDPTKNAAEASSEAVQARNHDWWGSTAYTRLEPDGVVLVIQTRWNEKDLMGRILTDEEALEDDDVWYVLNLPALAEEHDALGREVGAPLWPERYPERRLQGIKARIGARWFTALYQQRPSPLEGGMFKRAAWQYYDEAPQGYNPGFTFVDSAGWTDDVGGDWFAYASVVRQQKDLFWLNAAHGHWTFTRCVEELKNEYSRTGLPVCVEDVPWARPLIEVLKAELGIGAVVTMKPTVAKEVRAEAVTPYHEGGHFYLPRRGQWTGDFVEEHAAFPNGAHDDWVDTTSMAGLRLLAQGAGPGGRAMSYA